MGFSNNLKNLCFRKEWDSNPCCITTNILSRDALSTAQPPLLYLLAAGLEPATHKGAGFKSAVFTNFTKWACWIYSNYVYK